MRIAISSKEQNGYRRHRTRPVLVSGFPGPPGAQEPSRDGDLKNKKTGFWFQGGSKKISALGVAVADAPFALAHLCAVSTGTAARLPQDIVTVLTGAALKAAVDRGLLDRPSRL